MITWCRSSLYFLFVFVSLLVGVLVISGLIETWEGIDKRKEEGVEDEKLRWKGSTDDNNNSSNGDYCIVGGYVEDDCYFLLLCDKKIEKRE